MNTQIQKGLAEPYGDRSLANAVGARLLVEVPSWMGIVWRPENEQLDHESNGGRFENLRICGVGHILGRRSAALTMNTQIQKGLAEPYRDRSLANAVGAKLLVEVPSWTGVVWRPGIAQLDHESDGGCFEHHCSCKVGRILAEEAPP